MKRLALALVGLVAFGQTVAQAAPPQYANFRYVECYSGKAGDSTIARFIVGDYNMDPHANLAHDGLSDNEVVLIANLDRAVVVAESSLNRFVTEPVATRLRSENPSDHKFVRAVAYRTTYGAPVVALSCASSMTVRLNSGATEAETVQRWRQTLDALGKSTSFVTEAEFNAIKTK